jgi:leucyl-tRNA synthetase
VQVNGKVRAKIDVAADTSEDSIIEEAKANVNVQKFLEGKEIKMCKVIPGKLVTFAVK